MSAARRQRSPREITKKYLPHLPYNARSGLSPTDDTPQREGAEIHHELGNQLKPGVHQTGSIPLWQGAAMVAVAHQPYGESY